MINENNMNMQCYAATIGICKRADCKFRHVPGAQAGEGFSKEMANKIKPGVDKVTASLVPLGGGMGRGTVGPRDIGRTRMAPVRSNVRVGTDPTYGRMQASAR
eukprot:scaffold11665_cov48-Cyclotella_meneghiniana.AAC.3